MRLNKCTDYDQWKRARWGIDWLRVAMNVLDRHGPKTICEVGIGPLDISALPWFAETQCRLIGVEANPEMAEKARAALPLAEIHEKAVWHTTGETIRLEMNGGSSGIEGQWKPTPGRGQFVNVQTVAFDDLDDGTIDVLNIDCEGCEHFVLERLKSRPAIIGIELWPSYPKAAWCEDWLLQNGYRPIFATGPESETQIWEL